MRIFTLRPDAANIANPESGVDFVLGERVKFVTGRERERERWLNKGSMVELQHDKCEVVAFFLCMFFVDDMPYSSNTCLIQTPYQIVSIWSTLTPHFFNPRFITRHFGNGGFIKTSVQINLSNMFLSCSDYVFRVLWHQSHNFGT